MAGKLRLHVFISGRVQGVFFRAETLKHATKLGVNGWVRNTADGRVEAVFEGDSSVVEQMLGFCNRGPMGAHVDNVEVEREDFRREFSGFGIRY